MGDAQQRLGVAMGDGTVAAAPSILCAPGIGSCVAVMLYDTVRKTGGMAHVMLSDSARLPWPAGPFQCADTAIPALIEKLRARGSCRQDLIAKMAGGARLFCAYGAGDPGIGREVISGVKQSLWNAGIPLLGWDVAACHGRSVEFFLESGTVLVKALGIRAKRF